MRRSRTNRGAAHASPRRSPGGPQDIAVKECRRICISGIAPTGDDTLGASPVNGEPRRADLLCVRGYDPNAAAFGRYEADVTVRLAAAEQQPPDDMRLRLSRSERREQQARRQIQGSEIANRLQKRQRLPICAGLHDRMFPALFAVSGS